MSLGKLNMVEIECSISLWYEQFKSGIIVVDVFTLYCQPITSS